MEEQKEGIYETETCMVFFVKLPDVKKEDIGLEMGGHKLEVKVKGTKKIMKSEKEIIPEKANAIFKGDILRIEVPKAKK
ncbi:Hsp20/alpha crystallin family protein [Candidatus Woesearchaeota archaeon]|nr:Hsp20/alpha crystallin family protein [Candidatus Woesearchaeota archaeon]